MAFAVSAVVAAVAAPTIASVAAAVAAVGVATSVVGVVTGHQNLVKIGGELGLIGGVTGLANSAFTSLAADGVAGAMGEAGVAEGATAGAYSDVAGEQFALDQGMDAAGSGFAAGAGADGISAANGALSGGAVTSSVVQPATTAIGSSGIPPIDGSLAGSPGYSVGSASSASGASGIGTEAAAQAPQTLSDSTLNDAYSDVAGEKYAIANGGNANGSISQLDKIKNSLGGAWDKLSPQAQAEIAKSALAIPGGIQNQKNTEAMLNIQQQRLNQTSHGSEVPTFGIIQKAMKG